MLSMLTSVVIPKEAVPTPSRMLRRDDLYLILAHPSQLHTVPIFKLLHTQPLDTDNIVTWSPSTQVGVFWLRSLLISTSIGVTML